METIKTQLFKRYSSSEIESFNSLITDLKDFIIEYKNIIKDIDIDVLISTKRIEKYLHFVIVCNDSDSHKFNSDVINDCITIYYHLIQLLSFKLLPYYDDVISRLRTHLHKLKQIQLQPNHLYD